MLRKDVEKYQTKFAWLKDSKFLQELENDSVDSEILEEELTALQEEEILTNRQKLVKCLQSNPVQVLLCVVVLLDAGIVIAQILLDLHSVRDKLQQREGTITELLDYIRSTSGEALHGYMGNDVHYILQMLHDHQRWQHSNHSDDPLSTIKKHSASEEGHHPPKHAAQRVPVDEINANKGQSDTIKPKSRTHRQSISSRSANSQDQSSASAYDRPSSGQVMQSQREHTDSLASSRNVVHSPRNHLSQNSYMQSKQHSEISNQELGMAQRTLHRKNMQSHYDSSQYSERQPRGISANHSGGSYCDAECKDRHRAFHENKNAVHSPVAHEEHDTLHEVAHGLHFASIALLGFLVLEDLVKMCAMGRSFFKHKIEIFDAIIIISSFLFDIIFLGGVTGEEGEKAAAVLVVLLLWRITRVVDGILITAKQRQEFRIRLQKRARRRMEKRIDMLEDERHNKSRQITALKDLCVKAGVNEDTIEQCTPKPGPRRVSHTMCALSSVARLSVSMTMSMSSGLFSMADDEGDKDSAKSGEGDDKLSIEYYSSGRRHSLPNPISKMSDIDEESMSACRDDIFGSDSPINSSGIRIIIDEGSEPDLRPQELDLHAFNQVDVIAEEEPGKTQAVVEPSPSSSKTKAKSQPKKSPEQTKVVIEELEMDDLSNEQQLDSHDLPNDILLGRDSPDADMMDDDRRMSRISNCPLIV